MQNYDQSDGGTEDEAISFTISEPPTDDNYDDEEEDDEYFNDRGTNEYGGHSFSSDHTTPELTTLLNGPQWQKPDPRQRRAVRVDYSEKKLAAAAKKPAQSVKVRFFSSFRTERKNGRFHAVELDFFCNMGTTLWHILTAAETRN